MGFNLKMFFEELELMIKEGSEADALLAYIEAEKQYAEQCNAL